MTFHLNVQFAGTLLREKPTSIWVMPSVPPTVRDKWWPTVWIPKKGVIAFTRQDNLPTWRIPMAPYWFTVHRWIAGKKGLTDARPESERM